MEPQEKCAKKLGSPNTPRPPVLTMISIIIHKSLLGNSFFYYTCFHEWQLWTADKETGSAADIYSGFKGSAVELKGIGLSGK